MELKLAGREPLEKSLKRTTDYMNTFGAREGWLVVFDRGPKKSRENKLFREDKTLPGGKVIHVVGCREPVDKSPVRRAGF